MRIVLAVCLIWTMQRLVAADELEGKGFEWRSALTQSKMFLGIQHGFRIATEPGSRAELKGPFWRDYRQSIKGYGGWSDGDPFIVNYIGHPMMGAIAGGIQVQNDPRGRTQTFGWNHNYWHSRAKALGWSSLYSLQFELGPFSEASVGNVGKDMRAGAVDLVVTPVLGLGWQVTEDALDHHLVQRIERRISNRVLQTFARSALNPARSFTNMLRFKAPWYRDTRPGVWNRSTQPANPQF